MTAAAKDGSDRFVIDFKANPTQHQFIISRADADLFSCRMGEGKSCALVWSAFYHQQMNPHADWCFIRDSWENLRDTTLQEFFEWFPAGIAGEWKETTHTWTWSIGEMAGQKVKWIGLTDPKDASKLQSRFFGGFAIDEPAPASGSGGVDEEVFNAAMSRLRQKNVDYYVAKLATNNPDETHWTYRKFVSPGTEGYALFQTHEPENERHLPPSYYEKLRVAYADRPDLVDRFVNGKFGFQRIGMNVTPSWSDDLHLADNLEPEDRELVLAWDWGLNPTCIITQPTSDGGWRVLESHVGGDEDGYGAYQLIENVVRPRMNGRFKGLPFWNTGDPQGKQRDQADSRSNAIKVLRKELGGSWKPGPVAFQDRVDPLEHIMTQHRGGRGLLQVDREKAKHVWFALRGGWCFPRHRSGVVGTAPIKNVHSHPGDAMGYAAAVLFPMGRVLEKRNKAQKRRRKVTSYWGQKGSWASKPAAVPMKGKPDGNGEDQPREVPNEERRWQGR